LTGETRAAKLPAMSVAKKSKSKSRATKPAKIGVVAKAPRAKTAKKAASSAAAAVGAASGDWRSETLDRMRQLILQAAPDMIEERKWVKPTKPLGVPTWSLGGLVCTGEIYQKAVKLTFARGASLPDPKKLFNASLDGGTRRAIDIPEGGKVDPAPFKALVKAAVALNLASKNR
jgi:hypothetical protein